jgi:hypothetical protein
MPEPIESNTPVVTDGQSTDQTPVITPVNLKDDDLVEVVWKGEKVVKPWKEARANIQMNEDYTRGKQEVAKQAKELKELYEGLKGRELSVKEKEEAIDRILGRSQVETKPDPNEVLTRAQLQDILAQERGVLAKEFESKLSQQTTRADQDRMFQRWEDLTESTVESLVKENPQLKSVPQLAFVLKREALEDKPQTEKEMTAAIVKAGKRIAQNMDESYAERRKADSVRKQQLTTKGSEPAGGTSVFAPSKKTYGERGKIHWDELEKDVLAAVEGLDE